MGMTTLCGTVVLLNEEATGLDVRIILQELGLELAQDRPLIGSGNARAQRARPPIGDTQ